VNERGNKATPLQQENEENYHTTTIFTYR